MKSEQFLPDFCRPNSVFFVVLSAELLAIVLTLAADESPGWTSLGLYSLMIQWTALSSSALLCGLRARLSHFSVFVMGFFAYLLILLATFTCSIIAIWILYQQADFSSFGRLESNHWQIILKNLSISSIIGAVLLRYFYLQQDYRYRLAAESKAKIEALHARIHPHFLFNTLNTIAALVKISPKQSEQAIEDLASLMRAVLNDVQLMVPWKRELTLCQQYLALEKLRLGERLIIQFDADSIPDDFPVPSLFLQPLIENAIIHGIASLPQGGTLSVSAQYRHTKLCIEVENPMAPQQINKRHGPGVGLDNVTNRLKLLYGMHAQIKICQQEDLFKVSLQIPEQQP